MPRLVMMMIMIWPVSRFAQSGCDRLLNEGDSLYDLFDNRAAFERYSQAHAKCRDEYDGLMKLTRALIDMGGESNIRNAKNLYKQGYLYADTLGKYYPDSAQSFFLKALAAANISRLEQGTQRVKLAKVIEINVIKSIARDSAFAPAWVLRGGYYRQVASAPFVLKAFARVFLGGMPKGTLADAERALRTALKISPVNVYAYLELARTVAAMGDKKQAIRILEKMQNLPRAWHGDNRLKEEGLLLLNKLKK